MNQVDSSAYLEYFQDAPNAEIFAPIIENVAEVIVSSISIYEVFKKMKNDLGLVPAEEAVMHMKQSKMIDFDFELALIAARFSTQYKLPMADSMIYATAHKYGAILWTQDKHFDGLPGVQFIAKVVSP